MQRGAFFCLWILFTFSLFAQNKENGSVACDSIVYKNTFGKALKKFLNFSDFDTTYISPNRYNYALMLDHFTNYEYYSVGNDDQRLRFSPNPHNKMRLLRMALDIPGMGCRYGLALRKEKQEKARYGV